MDGRFDAAQANFIAAAFIADNVAPTADPRRCPVVEARGQNSMNRRAAQNEGICAANLFGAPVPPAARAVSKSFVA